MDVEKQKFKNFEYLGRSRSDLLAAFLRAQIGEDRYDIEAAQNGQNRVFQIFVKTGLIGKS